MKYFKRFKLTNIKRFVILGVTMLAAILTISLGSSLYISKNSKKSIEYGGGAEFVVKIEPSGIHKTSTSNEIASQVAQEIYQRIDALGIAGANVEPETSSDGAQVRVTYPGVTTDEERKELENLITQKPLLTFTDIYGNPLFNKFGHFNASLNANTKGNIIPADSDSMVPMAGSAAPAFQGGHYVVKIGVDAALSPEWTKATQYLSSHKDNSNKLVVWLNLKDYINKLKNEFPKIWASSSHNPYAASHIIVKDSAGLLKKNEIKPKPILRTELFNAGEFMISSPEVKKPLSGTSFVIEGSFENKAQAADLASKINYGTAHYKLKLQYSNYVTATYGENSFKKAAIAGLIVFALIAAFLIANYGLLGALSTISIALYMFITLSLFTVMRGEYSPEAIAALIIGVGMAIDANIITYERLKNEIYAGSTLQRGFSDANKKSLSSIFDSNITTLIVAFVLFFFGTRNIIGLSVTLILSIMLTLVVMLGFTRFITTLLVKTKIFDDKKHLLGIRPKIDKPIQAQINKYDYVKNSKWFALGSGIIFTASLITLIIFVSITGHFSGGFNLSQEFTGGTVVRLIPHETDGTISAQNAQGFADFLATKGIDPSKISMGGTPNAITSLSFETSTTFDDIGLWKNEFNQYYASLGHGSLEARFTQSITTTDVAQSILKKALIAVAVAIGTIVLYTLLRFRWTYSISAIVALLHDALIVIGFFILVRIEISPVFIAGLLSIIGYSINDTIVTFDRLRENMKNIDEEITKEKIKEVANTSIKETLKRSILTSLTTIMAVVVLMSFGNATRMAFNLAMFVGLIAGTYSSIFIATFLWTKLEEKRQKAINKRGAKGFWEFDDPEEQTFVGINDFND